MPCSLLRVPNFVKSVIDYARLATLQASNHIEEKKERRKGGETAATTTTTKERGRPSLDRCVCRCVCVCVCAGIRQIIKKGKPDGLNCETGHQLVLLPFFSPTYMLAIIGDFTVVSSQRNCFRSYSNFPKGELVFLSNISYSFSVFKIPNFGEIPTLLCQAF